MSKRTIKDYQLLDHGIDHAQYFHGCGISLTKFDRVATGCGSHFAEAIENALEQIAMDGFDADGLEKIIKVDEMVDVWPESPSVSELQAKADRTHEDFDEYYYYVSIRYNIEEEHHDAA